MIATADGRATIDGRTAPIANRADYELFHALRGRVDAVMVGAETIRVEGYGPMAQLAVVVSRSVAMPTETGLLAAPENRVVIVTPSLDAELPPCAASVSYLREADLATALRRLRAEYGVASIDCEGGPGLNATLVPAGLVDELHLVIAPKLAGGHDPLDGLQRARAARPHPALTARVGRLPVPALRRRRLAGGADERAPRGDAELAVDAASVGPHRLDPDLERERDLGVRAVLAQQEQHIALALRQHAAGGVRRAADGRARHQLQAAGGEVDRIAHVACLRPLVEADAGAEGQQLRRARRVDSPSPSSTRSVPGCSAGQVAHHREVDQLVGVDDQHVLGGAPAASTPMRL